MPIPIEGPQHQALKSAAKETSALTRMTQGIEAMSSVLGHLVDQLRKVTGYLGRLGALLASQFGVPRLFRGPAGVAYGALRMGSGGGGRGGPGGGDGGGEGPGDPQDWLDYHEKVLSLKRRSRREDQIHWAAVRRQRNADQSSRDQDKVANFILGQVSHSSTARDMILGAAGSGQLARLGDLKARDMLKLIGGMRSGFSYLDLETIGLGREGELPIPIQVGVTQFDKARGVTSVQSTLVRPQRLTAQGTLEDVDPLSPEYVKDFEVTARLMGTTAGELAERLKTAPYLSEVMPSVAQSLGGGRLGMSYNTQFDFGTLGAYAEALGHRIPGVRDVFEHKKLALHGEQDLQAMLEAQGIPRGIHTAGGDSLAGSLGFSKALGFEAAAGSDVLETPFGRAAVVTPIGDTSRTKPPLTGIGFGLPPLSESEETQAMLADMIGGTPRREGYGRRLKKPPQTLGALGATTVRPLTKATEDGTARGAERGIRHAFRGTGADFRHLAGVGLSGLGVGAALLSAGAPDAAGLVFDSFRLLAAQIGQTLIPAAVQLASIFQSMASWVGRNPGAVKGIFPQFARDNPGAAKGWLWNKMFPPGGDKDDPTPFLLGISHSRTQPSFSGVEEAYNRIALEVVGKDPITKKLDQIQTESLDLMLEELRKQGVYSQDQIRELKRLGVGTSP